MAGFKFNGQLYGWSVLSVTIAGLPISGITAIDCSVKSDLENMYGAGNEPFGRGIGRTSYEGKVTLYMEEVAKLVKASPNGQLHQLGMFDIKMFLGDNAANVKIKQTMKYAQFKEYNFTLKEGDKGTLIEIPIVYAGLDREF